MAIGISIETFGKSLARVLELERAELEDTYRNR